MEHGRKRVVIEAVAPEIDAGRFPIKRVAGDTVVVEADVFADGHDVVAAALLWRREDEAEWHEEPMRALVNDRWRGEFAVPIVGRYRYTLRGWIDRFATWARDLEKRAVAGQDLTLDLQAGATLVEEAAARASADVAARLRDHASALRDPQQALAVAGDDELNRLLAVCAERRDAATYERELGVVVDRERARFSTWYELFPRSTSPEARRHGTFADVRRLLPDIAALGFDVLYFPPIHPIGTGFRKGKNNALAARPEDPASPWAIGSPDGGHTAIHPGLGTVDDLRGLVAEGTGIAGFALEMSPTRPKTPRTTLGKRTTPRGRS